MGNDIVVARQVIAFYGRYPRPAGILDVVVEEPEMVRAIAGKAIRRQILTVQIQAVELDVVWTIGERPTRGKHPTTGTGAPGPINDGRAVTVGLVHDPS